MALDEYTKNKIIQIWEILSGTSTEYNYTVNKFGENLDIDTADTSAGLQVIWPVKRSVQDYPFIDSPISGMTVQSSSADDASDGIGAQIVTFVYHDADGVEQTTDITMDGTTGVSFPETYGCFRAYVKTSGTSHVNVGDITLEKDGVIYCIIGASEGQTLISVQRIPNNATSAILKYARITYARVGTNNDATLRLKVRKANGTMLTKLNVELTSTGLSDFEKKYDYGGINLEPGDWVYWSCVDVSANDTPIAGYFDILEAVA